MLTQLTLFALAHFRTESQASHRRAAGRNGCLHGTTISDITQGPNHALS
jgi:hypothetical protein